MMSSEDELNDEEKSRRRAERRRARRKRQKERKKKLEREDRMEDASEQGEEVAGAPSDSEEEHKEEDDWIAVPPRNKGAFDLYRFLVTTKNKTNQWLSHRTSEEEPEWDVNSAFVANAASHIKSKGLKTKVLQISRENKENETRSRQVENTELKRRGESLTVRGIHMFERGQYSQAVETFTAAIYCDPKDHRFFGNRSYCYWFLEQYAAALTDAQRSIKLAPDWPKGYFRKGCALMGLKRYSEAEKAMHQVLELDQECKEASSKLFHCRVLQLMEFGFEEQQSEELLEKFTTVQAVLTSSSSSSSKDGLGVVVAAPEPLESDRTLTLTSQRDQSGSCRSLWVGNISLEVSKKQLYHLFKTFGEIESIRILYARFCAFVNFKNADMAAKALEKLQGVELGGCRLVMRYPDRWIQRTNPGFTSDASGFQQGPNATGSRWRLTISTSTGGSQAVSVVRSVASNTPQTNKVEAREHSDLNYAL